MYISAATEKKTASHISYFLEGDTKNPPLVLLPGFTGMHKDLLDLAKYLKEDYFLIFPEFPGWGDSPKGDSSFTITSYTHALKDIFDSLSLKKVSIAGHCMGAVVGLEYAYEFPNSVDKLILVSVPYQNGTAGQIFFSLLGKLSEKVPRFLRPFFFFWRSRIITIPMSFFVLQTKTFHKKLHLIEKTLTEQTHQNEDVLEKNWISLISYNYKKLQTLKVPVFLIHGAKDLLVSSKQAEKFSKLLPESVLRILPNAGHLPPVEEPETVAHAIRDFLTK